MSVALGSFLAFGAAQVATPGPANMAMMATGARFGFRAALPFVAGVVLGKQLIIWPVGFGLMELADLVPWLFEALKWACLAYIGWLAWRLANQRLAPGSGAARVPGFFEGLIVHPLNPKAWAMIVTGYAGFVKPETPVLQATAIIAICFLCLQVTLHPLWALGGDRIARRIAGTEAERYLMGGLAAVMVAAVLIAVFGGEGTP